MLAALLICVLPSAYAQFSLAGHVVQVHGFFSQGFLYSDQNNYLTMPTSSGSFALTDGGVNLSTRLTSHLRVGAQGYVRKIGNLGNGRVTLDWASADYSFNDHVGIRAGKVKTVFGLYNDTQDVEYLHTWALLPQSLYSLDLRGLTISHLGVDIYGSFTPHRLGTFAYTIYGGKSPSDPTGGNRYALSSYGIYISQMSGTVKGADVKWTTPLAGLMLGGSFLDGPQTLIGKNEIRGGPFRSDTVQHNTAFSVQYTRANWRLDFEHARRQGNATVLNPYGIGGPPSLTFPRDSSGWYVSGAYRFNRLLEIGTYHSRFLPNANRNVEGENFLPPAARHINDQAITARFDVKRYWDLKVEGHFMNGYGDPATSRGFYPQNNPAGLQPRTNLLIIRLGFNR